MSKFAVAVRDGSDLFLWIRLRRAPKGDLYYIFPTGRHGRAWKRWNPHGSLHRDGTLHHKSYNRPLHVTQVRKPNAAFQGTLHFVQRGVAPDEPRGFGVVCHPSEFDEVMEIPVSRLSPNKFETCVYVDVTDAVGAPSINTATGGTTWEQRAFKDAVPWLLVSLTFQPFAAGLARKPFP
jgi:hypothetical protein